MCVCVCVYRRRHLQDESRAAVRLHIFIYIHIYIQMCVCVCTGDDTYRTSHGLPCEYYALSFVTCLALTRRDFDTILACYDAGIQVYDTYHIELYIRFMYICTHMYMYVHVYTCICIYIARGEGGQGDVDPAPARPRAVDSGRSPR